MELLTPVNIPHSEKEISYNDKILLLGSCFSENMLRKFQEAYFRVSSNPFGILYNPMSIAKTIDILLSNNVMQELQIVQHNGLWHSMCHHGDFSCSDLTTFEENINKSIYEGRRMLEEATVVIVTFGTAWVYEQYGKVVGNCHKLPQDNFVRRRLHETEIIEQWQRIINCEMLKHKHFIFTVSPIRHLKDGLHQNQLSKATLLLAIEQLMTIEGAVNRLSYFPSYEILLDELRDYRYFADDMLHPSSLATEYIWQRFCQTYLSDKTRQEMKPLMKLYQSRHHLPLHKDSREYQLFCNLREKLADSLRQHYSWI